MVWGANADDVILAEIATHLDFDNDDRNLGVIAKRVMRTQRDVDRIKLVQTKQRPNKDC